jgi:hypothetical protein
MMEFKNEMMAIDSLEMEEATENLGALPSVGESTNRDPTKASVRPNTPTAIVVEMFPTTEKQSSATTPWLLGAGTVLAMGLVLVAVAGKISSVSTDLTSSPAIPISRPADAKTPGKGTLSNQEEESSSPPVVTVKEDSGESSPKAVKQKNTKTRTQAKDPCEY